MPTIYYLQWHVSTAGSRREEAADLFYTFHHDPPDTLEDDTFDRLYEEVATVDTDDLEQLFAEWNRGSGRESDQFQELRYCERCETYIDGHEEAVTHAAQNHGYDALTASSDPDYIRGERSLSVGDIVERDDRYYACAPVGWEELELVAPDGGTDDLTMLAALYHRDKLAHTLHYPREFVGPAATLDSFDYFPEEHYRQGFEQLRGTVSDTTLDEWIDDVIGTRPAGATHSGLWRDDIPQRVADILTSSQRYEVEIEIRPETAPDGYDYVVEWRYIDFDRDDYEWKPVTESSSGDAR